MNYKNNLLLSKKKYKIVNQKAGSIQKWTLEIKLPKEPINVKELFEPFKITILQDSGITGSIGIYTGYYYYGLERIINDKTITIYFNLYEDGFINLLYKYSNNFGQMTPDYEEKKEKLDSLQLTPDVVKFIAASIAFPPCYPLNFKVLHETAKNIFTDKYNTAKRRCEERGRKSPIRLSRCGDIIGWMINYKNNIESINIINGCK